MDQEWGTWLGEWQYYAIHTFFLLLYWFSINVAVFPLMLPCKSETEPDEFIHLCYTWFRNDYCCGQKSYLLYQTQYMEKVMKAKETAESECSIFVTFSSTLNYHGDTMKRQWVPCLNVPRGGWSGVRSSRLLGPTFDELCGSYQYSLLSPRWLKVDSDHEPKTPKEPDHIVKSIHNSGNTKWMHCN